MFDPAEVELHALGEPVPGPRILRRSTGGSSSVKESLATDWPFKDNELGIWTPGFVLGLEMSGAIRRSLGSWRLRPAGSRPWLEEDLKDLPCSGRLSGVWTSGQGSADCRRLHDFWVGEGYVEDCYGSDVLAGLLCGAQVKQDEVYHNRNRWLTVPSGNREFLKSWGINFEEGHLPAGRVELRISPFWGALCSRLMPECSRRGLKEIVRPAQCPVLPAVLVKDFLGQSCLCSRVAPYCRGNRHVQSRMKAVPGKKLKIKRASFREFGITFMHPWLREELESWRKGACTGCPGHPGGGIRRG